MSILRVGPVSVDLRQPNLQWRSPIGRKGSRSASIGGVLNVTAAHQLSELVANRHRESTVGDSTGVLEYVDLAGAHYASFRGWYLLQDASVTATRPWVVTEWAPFELSGLFLGPRQPTIIRSGRSKPNTLGLIGTALVADPFYDENTTGGTFVISPGTQFNREYDARGHALEGGSARYMTLYSLPPSAPVIALPSVEAPLPAAVGSSTMASALLGEDGDFLEVEP